MAKYINADEFLNLFHAAMESKGLSETDSWFCYRDLERVISATQTADVRENTPGHWFLRHYITPQGSNRDYIDMWVCSKCGQEFSCDEETGVCATDYCFCPNCGAAMHGVLGG